jgi:putative Mg2+ transporter-C (MgtC) family protein
MLLQNDTLEILLRLFCAALMGGLIGFERELNHKPAGMRTHILIAVGAALFSIFSIVLLQTYPGQADVSRIVSQIVVGVGFLGAGTIMRSEGSIGGLTTAAAIWVVAAIGTFTGFGLYKVAGLATLLVFVILLVAAPFEKKMASKFRGFKLGK